MENEGGRGEAIPLRLRSLFRTCQEIASAHFVSLAMAGFSMVRVVKPEPAEDSADIFLCPPQACLLEKGGWKPVPPDR